MVRTYPFEFEKINIKCEKEILIITLEGNAYDSLSALAKEFNVTVNDYVLNLIKSEIITYLERGS